MTALKGGIPIIGKVPQAPEPEQPGKGQKIARVDQMRRSVEAHLAGISQWFAGDAKLTLVIRANGDDMIFTNDTADEAVAALVRNEQRTDN